MPGPSIPEVVRRLVAERIDSVPELEAILLLREAHDVVWTPGEAGKRLYVSTAVATYVLAVLAERGFFVTEAGGYRYRPANAELADAVDELAHVYAHQLVAVTQIVHAKPRASVRQFADAFRLRRDK